MTSDPGEVTAAVTWAEVTFVEHGPDSIPLATGNHQPGSRFPIGDTEVTYWSFDDARNLGSCSFWITVIGQCQFAQILLYHVATSMKSLIYTVTEC